MITQLRVVILLEILSYLSAADLNKTALVSKHNSWAMQIDLEAKEWVVGCKFTLAKNHGKEQSYSKQRSAGSKGI